MKKITCMALLLILSLPAGAWAEETASFVIDAQHVYPGMDTSYAQGYVPSVREDLVEVVLPLVLKGNASCDTVTAVVDLGEAAETPFAPGNYANTFSWQRYEMDGGRVSCYLVRFSLTLKPDRVNGSYPILVNVEGVTGGGVMITRQFPLYVVIRDGKEPVDPDEPVSQPKLMVESFTYEPHPLRAGEEGSLSFMVRNMSATRSAKNIMLSFQDESGEVLPASTGSAYIPSIATGESRTCQLAVRATDTAAAGPHTVTVTMEYEDDSAVAFTAADTAVVDIEQPLRLEYEQPALPAKVTEGDNLAFSMNLMNMGKSTVYNALITFSISGLNDGGSVLAGNIEPGKSVLAKANLLVSDMDGRYGESHGKVILTYEDGAGELFTREMEVRTVIEEKIGAAPIADTKEAPKAPSAPWWAVAAVAAVLLGIAGAVTVQMIRAKRQREADELRL